jgi:hypothetical protein
MAAALQPNGYGWLQKSFSLAALPESGRSELRLLQLRQRLQSLPFLGIFCD